MTAFNVVRFRVKPGKEEAFVALHRDAKRPEGATQANLIKTGDRTYCFIGESNDMSDIVAARPTMIGILDAMRDLLEDLGGGLGVTDPVSGPTVAHLE
jgi:hypothetical protein